MIDCQAVGEPQPTVSWKRVQFNMTATGKYSRITQLQNNSLQIIAAQAEDSDRYMCHIFNKIGSSIEFVQISVQGLLSVIWLKIWAIDLRHLCKQNEIALSTPICAYCYYISTLMIAHIFMCL